MIVGCYALDLYCDNYDCPNCNHEYNEFPVSFTDEYGSNCRQQARVAGWKLDLKNGITLCPKCNI